MQDHGGCLRLRPAQELQTLTVDDVTLITVGFVAAFVSALIVVRSFLDFVSKRGFAPFAWWRIVVGLFGLAGLWIHG